MEPKSENEQVETLKLKRFKEVVISILSIVVIFLLFVVVFLYGKTVGQNEFKRTMQQENELIKAELEYQNNVDFALRNKYADIQAQLDKDEMYIWQYGTEKSSKAEFAAKVEDNPGRTKNILEITKHEIKWPK